MVDATAIANFVLDISFSSAGLLATGILPPPMVFIERRTKTDRIASRSLVPTTAATAPSGLERPKFWRDYLITTTIKLLNTNQILSRLDDCFKSIGEKPVKLSGRIHDVFLEDFRRELNEIQSPAARRLYILAKLSHLVHLRVGEYVALTAAADMTGNFGVGVLLESRLADKLANEARNQENGRSKSSRKDCGVTEKALPWCRSL
jgi:ferritin-like metal-binding protein YciE